MEQTLPDELNFKFSELSIEDPVKLDEDEINEMELPNITPRVVNEDEIFDKSIFKPEPEKEDVVVVEDVVEDVVATPVQNHHIIHYISMIVMEKLLEIKMDL